MNGRVALEGGARFGGRSLRAYRRRKSGEGTLRPTPGAMAAALAEIPLRIPGHVAVQQKRRNTAEEPKRR